MFVMASFKNRFLYLLLYTKILMCSKPFITVN